jgi:phenylalanyl-tRNA synthetase beta chain
MMCATQNVGDVEWKPTNDNSLFHPGRSAEAWKDGVCFGVCGELHPMLAKRWKIEGRLALADVTLPLFLPLITKTKKYIPVGVFPEVRRDLAFVARRDADVRSLSEVMKSASSSLRTVEWFDTYRGKGIKEGEKSLAFHLTFGSNERTLETKEVDQEMENIIAALKKEFAIEVRA